MVWCSGLFSRCDCQFSRQKMSELVKSFSLLSPEPPNPGVGRHSSLSPSSPYSSWLWLSLRVCSRLTPRVPPVVTLYSDGQWSGHPGSLTTSCASSVRSPQPGLLRTAAVGWGGSRIWWLFYHHCKTLTVSKLGNFEFLDLLLFDKFSSFSQSVGPSESPKSLFLIKSFFAKECDIIIIWDYWDHWPQKMGWIFSNWSRERFMRLKYFEMIIFMWHCELCLCLKAVQIFSR